MLFWPHCVHLHVHTHCVYADFPRERVPLVLAPLLYQDYQDITEDRYCRYTLCMYSMQHLCTLYVYMYNVLYSCIGVLCLSVYMYMYIVYTVQFDKDLFSVFVLQLFYNFLFWSAITGIQYYILFHSVLFCRRTCAYCVMQAVIVQYDLCLCHGMVFTVRLELAGLCSQHALHLRKAQSCWCMLCMWDTCTVHVHVETEQ